jgi:SAM-dependent methyltransferase
MRDYNKEAQDKTTKYGYDFDYDIIHPFMLKAIKPFVKCFSHVLEMGSFKGDFTRLLIEDFTYIFCIEASDEAVQISKEKFKNLPNIDIIHSTFEEADLGFKVDNIIITHVLEHLDNPVDILKKASTWLEDDGRIFIICPNANAPSRQIAVKMGLISHNTAVTEAERDHGHLRTYTLDTLEKDARLAGLKVAYRTGIFFKALANFQWDKAIKANIISKEYLDACFELGTVYPDLCSSIMLVCEKGA